MLQRAVSYLTVLVFALSLSTGAAFAATKNTEQGKKAVQHNAADSCSYTGWILSGYTVLDTFEGGNLGGGLSTGGSPFSPVIQDACGNLYGTTASGGGDYGSGGVVYELPAGAIGNQVETTMHTFPGVGYGDTSTDGSKPATGLLLDSSGNVYGTAFYGATYNSGSCSNWYDFGAIFEVNAGSVVEDGENSTDTLLYQFSDSPVQGTNPSTGLVRDADGNLYGVGQSCGANTDGAVFELSAGSGGAWTLSTPYSFPTYSGTNTFPYGPEVNQGYLALDSSGNLYGTTYSGGTYANGSVFKLTPGSGGAWTATTLYSFKGGTTDGCNPYAEPVVDSSGNLYGTTYGCGSASDGAVWKLTSGGVETILHTFTGGTTDGNDPAAGVVLDSYGDLYGTAARGGANGGGTVYEISASGAYSILHDFEATGVDGLLPLAAPLVAQDGNIYGTTLDGGGGGNASGTIWGFPVLPSVSVTIAGTGTGTVSGTPAGISCPGVCRYASQAGDAVTLTATVGSKSKFTGWSGACSGTSTCSVTLSGTSTSTVTATFTSTLLPTTTTLTSSTSSSYYAQSVTFTAKVTASSGTPTGTATFYSGTTALGTATLSSGTATYSTAALPVGTDSVTAVYSGDANDLSSTSNALSQTVYQASTTASLTSSVNPSTVGESVTFTATVTGQYGGTPTGTVAFYEGTTELGTGTLSSGTGTYTTSSLAAGTHTITAVYGGDSNFTGSTSPAVSQVVNAATQSKTTTTLTSSPDASTWGESVTFTATVTSTGGTPTGNVTFIDETTSTTLGTVALSSGVATYATSSLSVGKHTIEASYAGNSQFKASSKTRAQTVEALTTTTTLTSSPNPSTSGETVTFTATVTAKDSSEVPAGSVTFTDTFSGTTTTLGTGTLNGSGEATFSTSSLAVGSHSIKAIYGATTDFKTSTSKALKQTVDE
jgi:uncharacterized repeat protein (TIGR03803 family)